jgi:hypothetical protein
LPECTRAIHQSRASAGSRLAESQMNSVSNHAVRSPIVASAT